MAWLIWKQEVCTYCSGRCDAALAASIPLASPIGPGSEVYHNLPARATSEHASTFKHMRPVKLPPWQSQPADHVSPVASV